jgi:hypothetical protein
MTNKTCTKCGNVRPLEDFYFKADRGRHDSWCKYCYQEASKRRRLDPDVREHDRLKNDEYRSRPEYKAAQDKRRRAWDAAHFHRRWAHNTYFSHKRRGIDVRLTVDELENMAKTHEHCMLCGKQLYWSPIRRGKTQQDTPTLDRINNEDFIDGTNVMVVCHKCNTMKNDLTLTEFRDYCIMIAKKFMSD